MKVGGQVYVGPFLLRFAPAGATVLDGRRRLKRGRLRQARLRRRRGGAAAAGGAAGPARDRNLEHGVGAQLPHQHPATGCVSATGVSPKVRTPS
ncbi:MAG: hypothetical protein Q8Q85_12935 [Gemmatimonadales bacterium]|nr:hypothetical protein [Gemmatimonadales bacterium]